MKAIFVIGDKLLDISQILSVVPNQSELALILEYQSSGNLVVAYHTTLEEYNTNYQLILDDIASRVDPDLPPPEPVPIPTKPDTKITLEVLQEILKTYALKQDVVFHNGAVLPLTSDFDYLLSDEDLHVIFPSLPSTSYLHQPPSWTSGLVLVGNIGGYSYNLAYSINNDCYLRTHNPDIGWNSWFKIPSETSIMSQVQALINNLINTVINPIQALIPDQASTSNQLADKAFVNSTIQTASANFRGNWETWSDVPSDSSLYPVDYAGSKVPTVNDYMVVQDASDYNVENEGTWRFKYSGLWSVDGKNGWHPEYQVNETPFTASQLASINSGITAEKVEAIPEIEDSDISENTVWSSQKTSDELDALPEIDDSEISANTVWSSSKTNSMIDAMFDICHPVGELYVQLPDMSDPNTLYGRGTWSEISSNYAGLFFRVVGGNASAFGTNQAEGLPNITGSWWGIGGKSSSDYSGAFSGTSPSSNKGTSGSSGAFGGTIRFGANYSNSIYGSSSHVTPVNTAIKIWKRTA